ncbi:MAG: hypothetical protein MUC88_00095 [Planctomycetes bacterium]|jgi:hypothetical protein|nr:hypothetical protein [Planctomycetota bacterium]
MQGNVSWRDYAGVEGYGVPSPDDLADLRKALTAGQSINNPGVSAGEGFPLRIESLENTLKVVTYRMDDVRLWQSVTKLPAFNTVEEHNRLREYGSGVAAFIDEGDLPESDDSTYSREYSVVKYMGVTRSVSHVMSLIRPAHGNVIAQETVNGTAWLLRQVERALFFGDSTMIPQQWDGLVKQITAGAPNPTLNVIDMRGRPLSEDALNDGCLIVKTEPNYGRATDLYLADGAFSDLAKGFYPAERIPLNPAGWQNGMVGLNIQGFYSQFGPIKFSPDTFIQFGPVAPSTAAGPSGKRPSTPTESVAPTEVSLGGGETSYWVASDSGDYYYKVCAINRYGRSAAVAMTGPCTVSSGKKVTMTVADGSDAGTAFELYRSTKDGLATTCKLAKTTARSGATTVLTDWNAELPGTSKAVLIQQNLEFFSFKQLAPFLKIPLATISTAIRWMQLIYGTPVVYAPGRAVIYKNVGRASGSAGLDNSRLYGV